MSVNSFSFFKKNMGSSANLEEDLFWQIDEGEILNPRHGTIVLVFNTFFNATHQVVSRGQGLGDLHQHSYRVQIRVKSINAQDSDQMIVPYEELRRLTEKISRAYEGKILNELPPFKRLQPTTENFVGVIAQQLDRLARTKPFQILEVTIFESPTISVTYLFKDR
jgi:6-pyruvoyltetrahydropterin/6-carboxytetrahydropterin synthase